ncbi:MAG: carboxypeptidase regulatory-like domain-containing protein [Nannocystaceae bacterium]
MALEGGVAELAVAVPDLVEVVVRDLDGRGIAGARLVSESVSPGETRIFETDEHGVATVPAGLFARIDARGLASSEVMARPNHGRVNVDMLPESSIVGVVVDPRGDPVPGADVALRMPTLPMKKVSTDQEGGFRIDGLTPGRGLLSVRGRGVLSDRLLAVGFAEQISLEVRAARAATIEARVTDDTGAPCAGGVVRFYDGHDDDICPICDDEDAIFEASIAADGVVHAEVARGLLYGVEVACHAMTRTIQRPILVDSADVTGLRWEVPRGLELAGTIVDGSGRPLSGATVQIQASIESRNFQSHGEREAMTDESGRFVLAGLQDGTYEISWGSSGEPVERERVTLAGADLKGLTFVHSPRSEPRRGDSGGSRNDEYGDLVETKTPEGSDDLVRGVVRSAQGEPISGAVLNVSRGDALRLWLRHFTLAWDGYAPTLSNSRGEFVIPVPPYLSPDPEDDPSVAIIAWAPGGAVGVSVLIPSDDPIEITVRRPVSVTAHVRDRLGRPILRVGVDIEHTESRLVHLLSHDGAYTIPGLLPGQNRVWIRTREGDSHRVVQVRPGLSPSSVNVLIQDEIKTLTVHLMDLKTGHDLAGCEVSLGPAVGPRRGPAVTDDHGYVEFGPVPTGPAKVHVRPCELGELHYPAQSKQIDALPGKEDAAMELVGHEGALFPGGGELGFTLVPTSSTIDLTLQPLRVKSLRPRGPAERAGLRVGDVLTKVDGHDVVGRRRYLFEGLTRVRAGRPVKLGLADGRTIEVISGAVE